MQNLQHRGKDGYGITYVDNSNSLISIKGKGELNNDILKQIINTKSKSCIGHLRYSTSGLTIKNKNQRFRKIAYKRDSKHWRNY